MQGAALRMILRALWQAEQVVRLFSVRFGLEILVVILAGGNDNPHRVSVDTDKEAIFSALNVSNGLLLGQSPARTIGVCTSDIDDALVRIWTVGFIDAFDLNVASHESP